MQICNWTGIFADTAGFAATVFALHGNSLHGAYVRFRAPPVPSSEKMLRHC